MSAERPKHPYEMYGLKIMAILRDFGTRLMDEEIRLLSGLTPEQFVLGTRWLEDQELLTPKTPFDPIESKQPFYLN